MAPLNVELLQRLEDRLRADGAEPLEGEGPGLAVQDVIERSRVLPAPLPAELILWWTWRTWGSGFILPDAQYSDLPSTLSHYEYRRAYAAEQPADHPETSITPDDWWSPYWLPILPVDGGVVVVANLADSDGDVAPLQSVDWQSIGSDHYARVVASSLGEFVAERLEGRPGRR